jgi:hypothetical protein
MTSYVYKKPHQQHNIFRILGLFLSLVASGHVQELLMHFHKITLYNVIAYCKRDDNHFYEWVISIFLIRFM